MTDKILEQLETVRRGGLTNMFAIHAVQRIAFDNGFYELVDYLESHQAEYFAFILTGKRPK